MICGREYLSNLCGKCVNRDFTLKTLDNKTICRLKILYSRFYTLDSSIVQKHAV